MLKLVFNSIKTVQSYERLIGMKNSEKGNGAIIRCERFEYRMIGRLRLIGVGAWPNEEWDALWARKEGFMPALDELMSDFGSDISFDCAFMHHNGRDVDSENHYLAGRFFKEGTPVPDGLDYYDVPTEQAAYAVYHINKFDGDIGAAYYYTRDQILSDGIGIPYPHSYWHASVYLDGRPTVNACRLGYLFSIAK